MTFPYFAIIAPRDAPALRVLSREAAALSACEGRWKEFGDQDRDESDAARAAVLSEILAAPRVTGTVHPGLDPADVLHVYLDGVRRGRVFACVVVSEQRLRVMLAEAELVVEGLSLQAASSPQLTPDSVRAAMEVWAARNFGRLPVFDLRPWIDAETAHLVEASGPVTVGFELEVDHRPPATLAEPPFEEAA